MFPDDYELQSVTRFDVCDVVSPNGRVNVREWAKGDCNVELVYS